MPRWMKTPQPLGGLTDTDYYVRIEIRVGQKWEFYGEDWDTWDTVAKAKKIALGFLHGLKKGTTGFRYLKGESFRTCVINRRTDRRVWCSSTLLE